LCIFLLIASIHDLKEKGLDFQTQLFASYLMNKYDLLLTGGHLIDPSQKIDGIKNVGFKDGRVVEVSDKLDHALAEKVHNISDNIITPGLIDLHKHIY
tara:strand:- start:4653 stop:4946 length:294 start_codon:yes stop_codon:yes gene_type:complete